MSTATSTRPPSRTPHRLPRVAPSRRERAGEVLRGLAAALVLLAVLAGVPLALVELVGNPLPDTPPARAWLDAELSASAVLDVLAVVLWLVWAHFVVCVLAETRAWIAGGGARAVPGGGANQLLAQRLVAAVLLLASGAVWVPGTVPLLDAVAVSAPAPAPSAGAEAGAARASAVPAPAGSTAPDPGWAAARSGEPVVHVVQPPQGRHHDCLWDIAERTLGDPLRYHEIFELNKDRVQPDGSRLVDADLIRPGWTLLLPADAQGAALTAPVAAPPSAPAAEPAGVSWAPTAAPATPEGAGPAAPGPADDLTSRAALSGGLLLAGVLVALRRRGGPTADGLADSLAATADPERARFLDHALRRLAADRAAAGLALPDVVAAHLSADELVLHLGTRAQGAAARPPRPWTVLEGGAWRVARADLPDLAVPGRPAPTVPAPFPALVDVARSGDHEVLLDLESAPGIVALGGDPGTARDVVASMAVELATNSWSDGVEVDLVGFGDDLSALAPENLRPHALLDEVLDRLERTGRAGTGTDLLAGRLERAGDRPRPRVVVVSGPPTDTQVGRLRNLVAGGPTPLAVVCVGDVPAASWRFAVTSDGRLDLGVLGLGGRARRLPPTEYAAWADALRP
ncbi:LysM peptidoglycan-binding domain-containing protein [Kineococcus radiotolerans]|uniref:Integral membrane protein n=1 Tax=Kineococcus radiotolerans (strain ATCC BAA-149 / DSM 14245 / SRS30216) TaxID=266940 RepID=A6WCQ0_KINRD|nr:integral membrane protein [Kineococcus radiotolerans]ABS04589.1 integral membrane protein [Kineococcus radiotolerans SRS30216 = ATCC BAA-149]